jgi:uncharacterized membrane protein YdfJ with MMPL/SSD domain
MFATFGCFIYRYRLVVVATWAILLLVAVPIATRIFQVRGADGFSTKELEGAQVDAVRAQRFGFDPGTLLVVYENPQDQLLATDPYFQARLNRTYQDAWTRDRDRRVSGRHHRSHAAGAGHNAPAGDWNW